MIRKQDNLWKGALEDNFPDFIRFIDSRADKILDLDKGVQFLDKELEQVFPPEDEAFSSKVADKLVRVFKRDGQEEWVLIHVEVQGKYTEDFGRRMFTYFYRILDKYNMRISAYAIFTEDTLKLRPDTFRLEFMGTRLDYKYNTYKITGPTDEELLADNNPFAIIVLAARAAFAGKHIKDKVERDQFIKNLKLDLIRHLLSRNIEKEKIRSLLNFIRFYIRFEFTETKAEFDKELEILTKNKDTMGLEEQIIEMVREEGREEGIEKGRQEGRQEGIEIGAEKTKEKLINDLVHDSGYTDEQIVKIIQVPLKLVRDIRKKNTKLLNEDKPNYQLKRPDHKLLKQ